MSLKRIAKRELRRATMAAYLVRKEVGGRERTGLPLRRRLVLWRHGFLSESDSVFDLGPDTWHLYVSDSTRMLRTVFINGTDVPILNDKIVFYHAMTSIGAPTPAVFGVMGETRMAWVRDDGEASGVLGLLERGHELVLKPSDGNAGRGVRFLARSGDEIRVDGAACRPEDLERLLVPGTLVCERARQGAYAERIAPMATNTIRLITMWDEDRSEPFVAAAMHKFGTAASAPVDNVGRGGLGAAIDVATGALGPARTSAKLGSSAWVDHHPDTGAAIRGATVPGWPGLVAGMLAAARRLAHIPYIGWDVVAGDQGHSIIEGNTHPELVTTQAVHGPLLADPRVRRFYARHGVISSA